MGLTKQSCIDNVIDTVDTFEQAGLTINFVKSLMEPIYTTHSVCGFHIELH